MKLEEVMVIMQNRMISLNDIRNGAACSGDIDIINKIDADLMSTQTTIDQLKITLQALSSAM
jgi:hypothetical protein